MDNEAMDASFRREPRVVLGTALLLALLASWFAVPAAVHPHGQTLFAQHGIAKVEHDLGGHDALTDGDRGGEDAPVESLRPRAAEPRHDDAMRVTDRNPHLGRPARRPSSRAPPLPA